MNAPVWRKVSPSFETTREAYEWLQSQGEGDWQLPCSDECCVGEELE